MILWETSKIPMSPGVNNFTNRFTGSVLPTRKHFAPNHLWISRYFLSDQGANNLMIQAFCLSLPSSSISFVIVMV